MPLTHIDSADFMKLLGVAVKEFSPYNVNFPVRWANNPKYSQKLLMHIQSGASSRAKIGGAYFSDVTGSIQDPIAVPGPCEVT